MGEGALARAHREGLCRHDGDNCPEQAVGSPPCARLCPGPGPAGHTLTEEDAVDPASKLQNVGCYRGNKELGHLWESREPQEGLPGKG